MATRWGIASAGKISSDFVNAIQILPSTDHTVIAVAARGLDRAKQFAHKFDIPVACGSYEELAKAENIDCIYIGSIHPQHFTLCKLFMNAGKNVLCEKPLCMNNKQAEELVKHAREKNLFFMEGFWSRFFPIYDSLRAVLASGEIGEVRHANANFGYLAEPGCSDRLVKKDLGGGALWDVGCYTLQFAQLVFKEDPVKINSSACINADVVDQAVTSILTYSGNRTVVIDCSLICELTNEAVVYGTKGMIKIESFWNPVKMTVILKDSSSKVYVQPLPKAKYPMIFKHSEGFVYEIEAVRQHLLKGEKESDKISLATSLQIIKISDEIRRQCGITCAED